MTTTLDRPEVSGPVSPPTPRPRRNTSTFRPTDAYALVGALIASTSLTTLIYTTLLPFSGKLGFFLLTWVFYLGFYALLLSFSRPGQAVKDKVVAIAVQTVAALMAFVLAATILYILERAWVAMRHLNFYTEDMAGARPTDLIKDGALTRNGVLHGIVATLEQIALATAMTVPVGLTCAVLLTEIPGRFSRIVRTVTEAMTALPSIVAGLFVFATYILLFHGPKSGFAAALALSIMMLPIIIRSADVVLRLVPGTLKEASLALGAGQLRTLWQVTLPTARSGLTTAVILGMARGIGETSPVLITAGVATNVNWNPFSGPQPSLPLLALLYTRSPSAAYIARGFGAAGTLLLLVLGLFIIARTIGGRGPGNLSKRQQRRAAAGSRRDVARFDLLEAQAQGHDAAEAAAQAHVIVLDQPPPPAT